jgi:hypothetical protein
MIFGPTDIGTLLDPRCAQRERVADVLFAYLPSLLSQRATSDWYGHVDDATLVHATLHAYLTCEHAHAHAHMTGRSPVRAGLFSCAPAHHSVKDVRASSQVLCALYLDFAARSLLTPHCAAQQEERVPVRAHATRVPQEEPQAAQFRCVSPVTVSVLVVLTQA